MPKPTAITIVAAAALTCPSPFLVAGPAAAAPACTLLTEDPGSITAAPARLIAAAPGPVDNLTVTPGDASATVTWQAPQDTGDLPITGYYLPLYTGSGITSEYSSPYTITSCTLTGLTNGTTYVVVVAARNVMGLGPGTKATFTPPLTGPVAPPVTPTDPPVTTPAPQTSPSPTSAPTSSTTPTPMKKRARVRLSAPSHKPGHRLTVRWHARHTDTVRLSWRRGTGKTHTQTTAPTGRITLAGPSGTRYHLTATAGEAVAHKTYRIK